MYHTQNSMRTIFPDSIRFDLRDFVNMYSTNDDDHAFETLNILYCLYKMFFFFILISSNTTDR